jgi:hypothetical protein
MYCEVMLKLWKELGELGLDRYNGLFLCILLAGLCVLMSACVYAGPLDETAILREEMLRKKQEMALLDYNAIEEMIGRAETLNIINGFKHKRFYAIRSVLHGSLGIAPGGFGFPET